MNEAFNKGVDVGCNLKGVKLISLEVEHYILLVELRNLGDPVGLT